MIWLSLKTYKKSSGKAVIKLLKRAKKISQETAVPIIPCAQATDIFRIRQEVDIEVWAQHVDAIDPGRHSGWISPYSVKKAGAVGTVINHAEHAISQFKIKKTINKANKPIKAVNLKSPLISFKKANKI